MGKLNNGIFGGFTGTVGNLVSYKLNGQQVIKSKPGPSNKPFTKAQLNNQQQMKVLSLFLKQIEVFLKMGFGPEALGSTCNFQNLAIKYNKPQALAGYYPEVYVDYSKIILSKGNLPQALNPAVTWVAEGLKFTWEIDSNCSWPNTEDQIMLMAYSAEKNKHFFLQSGARRTKGWEILDIPAEMHHERFELYISFVSDDRLSVADSQHIGNIGD